LDKIRENGDLSWKVKNVGAFRQEGTRRESYPLSNTKERSVEMFKKDRKKEPR